MGTTVHGLPYPEPTDPVAAGAAAIRSLAEAVDPRLDATVVAPQVSTHFSRPSRRIRTIRTPVWR